MMANEAKFFPGWAGQLRYIGDLKLG